MTKLQKKWQTDPSGEEMKKKQNKKVDKMYMTKDLRFPFF